MISLSLSLSLSLTQVLCTAILPLLSLLPHLLPFAASSILLACLHQFFLSLAGGTDYVLLGPSGDGSRTGLLSANREGVVSSVGYLAVYMAGIQLGQWLFRKRKTVAEFYPVVLFLGVGVVLLWTLTSVCEVYVQPVSRRMANLPFILWLVRNIGCRDGLCLLCKPLSKGHKNQPMLFLEPGVVSKIKKNMEVIHFFLLFSSRRCVCSCCCFCRLISFC